MYEARVATGRAVRVRRTRPGAAACTPARETCACISCTTLVRLVEACGALRWSAHEQNRSVVPTMASEMRMETNVGISPRPGGRTDRKSFLARDWWKGPNGAMRLAEGDEIGAAIGGIPAENERVLDGDWSEIGRDRPGWNPRDEQRDQLGAALQEGSMASMSQTPECGLRWAG